MTTTVPEDDSYFDVEAVEIDHNDDDEEGIYQVAGVVNIGSRDEAVVCLENVDVILINGTVSPVVSGENDGRGPAMMFDEVSENTNLMVSFEGESVAEIWIGDNLDQ